MFESTELAQNCFSLNLHFLSKCSLPNKKRFFVGCALTIYFLQLILTFRGFSGIRFDPKIYWFSKLPSTNVNWIWLVIHFNYYRSVGFAKNTMKIQNYDLLPEQWNIMNCVKLLSILHPSTFCYLYNIVSMSYNEERTIKHKKLKWYTFWLQSWFE